MTGAAPSHEARPGVAVVLPPREHFAARNAGAIALIVRRLAVSTHGFDVRVLGRPVARPFDGVAYVPVRQAWLPGPLPVRYAAGVARVLRRAPSARIEVHNRPDVAHALRRLGVPVMLFLHNDPVGMRGLRHIGGIDRVVAVSRWVAERTGRPDCDVLPNPIDFSELPAAPAARENLILFAGRVVADKGADLFVQACALALPRLPGWRAEMIGADGFGAGTRETPFLRALRPRAAAAGVAMLGWRPHAEVLRAMTRAAVVVVPGRWPEPFGMTALEAMACGAALIHAPRGGLPEVVGDAGVPIDPDDPAGIAAALMSLAADAARRETLGVAGRRRAGMFAVGAIGARLDALRRAGTAAAP